MRVGRGIKSVDQPGQQHEGGQRPEVSRYELANARADHAQEIAAFEGRRRRRRPQRAGELRIGRDRSPDAGHASERWRVFVLTLDVGGAKAREPCFEVDTADRKTWCSREWLPRIAEQSVAGDDLMANYEGRKIAVAPVARQHENRF